MKLKQYRCCNFSYLREFDEPEPHYTADAREVEAYWKRACYADFPKETKHLKYPLYSTWQSTYAELNYEKKQAEEAERKRLEKIKKQEEREFNKRVNKRLNSRAKISGNGWFMAVRYTFNGDAVLDSNARYNHMFLDRENSKDHKGLSTIELIYKKKMTTFDIIDEWGCHDDIDEFTLSGMFMTEGEEFTKGYTIKSKEDDTIINIIMTIIVGRKTIEISELSSDNDDVNIRRSILTLEHDLERACKETYKDFIRKGIIY